MAAGSSQNDRPLWSKLLWFVGLWGGGVATVLVVALIIRKMLGL